MVTGSPLGKLFGRSPIAPLQEHMQVAEEAVQLLSQLQTAASRGNHPRRDGIHAQLERNAREARDLHRDLRQHLPRGLLLAVPRPDMLTLLDLQQRLVHACAHAADSLALRDTQVPETLLGCFDGLGEAMVDGAGVALTAIREIDEMISEGFGEHERARIVELLDRLDARQEEARSGYQRLLRQLAGLEDRLAPLDAVYLQRIADALYAVCESCAGVGEQLRLLLAH